MNDMDTRLTFDPDDPDSVWKRQKRKKAAPDLAARVEKLGAALREAVAELRWVDEIFGAEGYQRLNYSRKRVTTAIARAEKVLAEKGGR